MNIKKIIALSLLTFNLYSAERPNLIWKNRIINDYSIYKLLRANSIIKKDIKSLYVLKYNPVVLELTTFDDKVFWIYTYEDGDKVFTAKEIVSITQLNPRCDAERYCIDPNFLH